MAPQKLSSLFGCMNLNVFKRILNKDKKGKDDKHTNFFGLLPNELLLIILKDLSIADLHSAREALPNLESFISDQTFTQRTVLTQEDVMGNKPEVLRLYFRTNGCSMELRDFDSFPALLRMKESVLSTMPQLKIVTLSNCRLECDKMDRTFLEDNDVDHLSLSSCTLENLVSRENAFLLRHQHLGLTVLTVRDCKMLCGGVLSLLTPMDFFRGFWSFFDAPVRISFRREGEPLGAHLVQSHLPSSGLMQDQAPLLGSGVEEFEWRRSAHYGGPTEAVFSLS